MNWDSDAYVEECIRSAAYGHTLDGRWPAVEPVDKPRAWLDDGDVQLYHGDALMVLAGLPSGSVQTCVTSPPYWRLRDYGVTGQLGLEATPGEYVKRLVEIFGEVRRVLRDDGTLWLNLGDTHRGAGPKAKDLVGIPWAVAFALRDDGWILRSEIIWAKPNPMPESVVDRPTMAHEQIFLLAKQARYNYVADAIREPHGSDWIGRRPVVSLKANPDRADRGAPPTTGNPLGRNCRSVWEIPPEPFPEAHFATFPEAVARRCILAGSRPGDMVLDPFIGSGTTALVARKHERRCIGIDLSEDYLKIAARRIQQLSLLADVDLSTTSTCTPVDNSTLEAPVDNPPEKVGFAGEWRRRESNPRPRRSGDAGGGS